MPAALSQATLAAIAEAVAAALAARPSRSAATSEASAHWKSRDIACSRCKKTFRTIKGAEWHAANAKGH